MNPSQVASRGALSGFYLLLFGVTGISLPFLPAYLKSLSLSATQVGTLLAISPLLSLLAPSFWGHLADRTGQTGRILTVLALGALLCLSPLLWVERFAALAATFAAYAFFNSSFTPLIDSLALHRVAHAGGSYAHLRLFGSLGFILSSTAFGLLAPRVDRTAVFALLGLIAALALWSFTLHAHSAPAARLHPLAGLKLLRHPDLRWLLAATSLHWLASAPYNATFSIHVLALGLSPAVVGLSAGLGVLAELAVMALYPRFADRLAPRHLLALAFVSSALRWAGVALVSSAPALVALSLLHGMTFGAFYVASIAFMARRVPPHLRASGQALYASVTFGLGGFVGYLSAGAGYDWLGGHRLFAVAAALELLAAALVLRAAPPPASEPLPDGAA
jgi:PPP family 3-phenylpropionic acid transporter